MNTKISHTMQHSTSGNATINVLSRVSTFTSRLVAILALLITMMGGTVKAADEVVYFHVNALGSATAAFNENGDVCWNQAYSPYGEQTSNADATPPPGCGLIDKERGFTGHTKDKSGLTYMQQRYYDPTIGRFLSIDPVDINAADPRTLNRYSYAANNPYRFNDPDGEAFETPWDALNVAIGVVSLGANLSIGNYGAAAEDLGGLIYDAVATVVPGLPGGAGTAIKSKRLTEIAKKTYDSTAKKRVGRHMSTDELDKMKRTGRVQEGGGGQTRVADPADSNAYRNSPAGDKYVEFDVPASRVKPHSKGTGRIPGPNSPDARAAARRGSDRAEFEMPTATNIKEL